MLDLAFGLSFAEPTQRPGLLRTDAAFQAFLSRVDPALRNRLAAGRARSGLLDARCS